MSKQKTITINGVLYDAHTGMRLSGDALPSTRTDTHSQILHKKQARTQTLNREHVKSPHEAASSSDTRKPLQVKRSPMIQKFAPSTHTVSSSNPSGHVISDIAPVKHPIHAKAEEHVARKKVVVSNAHPARRLTKLDAEPARVAVQPPAAHHIKQRSIEKALHNAKPATKVKKSFASRHPRLVSVSTASFAILLLGGYLTYLNLPNISVRVAAAQAGIAATYPSYQPSGYSLNGPVTYSEGQVSMKFAANVGPQSFTVNQLKSNWDSSALLENYVEQASEGEYQTLADSGLTIYAYNGEGAWVNGGIVHTIQGDAPLSPDQIRRIAVSM